MALAGSGLPYSPGLNHPNTYNWAWREYGNRVGGWRLIELFDECRPADDSAAQYRLL